MPHLLHTHVLDRSCAAGDTFAAEHLTDEPKAAFVSCEGACLKGEIARRAANLVAHDLAPERAVRICHGGAFLLNQGGMRELVAVAPQVIVVDGCTLSCGTRLAKAAFPDKELDTVVATSLYESEGAPFAVNELADAEIHITAREVANRIVAEHLLAGSPGTGRARQAACHACS